MVGHPHGGEAHVQRPLGVVGAHHALYGGGPAPLGVEPLGVLPVEGRVDLRVDEGRQRVRGHVRVDAGVVVGRVGQEVPRPGGALHRLHHLADRVARGDGEAVAHVPLAVAVPGEVHRQRQRVEATLLGARQHLPQQAAILPHVQLEHLRPLADLRDVRDARRRQRGQPVQRAVVPGRVGRRALALRVEHPVARRGAREEGQLHVLAEDLRRQVQRRLQPRQHVVVHVQLRVRVLGATQDDLVVRPRVQVVEHHLVRPKLGCRAQVRYVDRVLQALVGKEVHQRLHDRVE
mmetsp:Transcript_6242/g.22974  ORF Transcript_6242/g.22974 Transcript_6242/m.22974 type:complete len:290 (-) Transcript_6242:357-1226(-)